MEREELRGAAWKADIYYLNIAQQMHIFSRRALISIGHTNFHSGPAGMFGSTILQPHAVVLVQCTHMGCVVALLAHPQPNPFHYRA
jgi:hypothetical protein